MTYVNANRRELVLVAFEHLAIRSLVLIVWLPYMLFTVHVILPYVIALVHASLGNISLLLASGYTFLAIALLSVCLHLHVVLMRLLLLKPRLFWRSAYD